MRAHSGGSLVRVIVVVARLSSVDAAHPPTAPAGTPRALGTLVAGPNRRPRRPHARRGPGARRGAPTGRGRPGPRVARAGRLGGEHGPLARPAGGTVDPHRRGR